MDIKTLKNAFGIKALRLENLDQGMGNSCIYSSNGVFKSSFSRAIYYLGNSDDASKVMDRISELPVVYDLTYNGAEYNSSEPKLLENIIVYSKELYENEDIESKKFVSQTLLLPNLQKKLTNNVKLLDSIVEEITSLCKKNKINVTKLEDIADLINIDYGDRISVLKKFYNSLLYAKQINTDFIDFTKIDQKAYDVLDNDKFQQEVEEYMKIIDRKISSKLFDQDFNDCNYNILVDALESTKFLNETRKIVIDNVEYSGIEKFKELIDKELLEIQSDPEVIEQFKKVEKEIGTTKEATRVKEMIKKPDQLNTMAIGRNRLKLSKIREYMTDEEIQIKVKKLDEIEKDVNGLIEKSKSEKSKFENAIAIYLDRFKPAFTIEIEDQHDAKIGLKMPKIYFKHADNEEKKYKETDIYRLLSSGEKNALKILHLIVQYEALKDRKPLVILDDVVETFDYANRTALLAYINELIMDGCKVIVLTHNFEFYRTVILSTNLKACVAYKRNQEVVVQKNGKLKGFYKEVKKISDELDLIASIPLVREIIKITEGTGADYELMTNLLHFNRNTASITIGDAVDLIKRHISSANYSIEIGEDKYEDKYYDKLFKGNLGTVDSFDLKKKLILSIRIRMKCEELVIQDDFEKIANCTGCQTRFLYSNYKQNFNEEFRKLYEKALLITPEFIHYNAFMFEPLIDISPNDLLSVWESLDKTRSAY